MSKPPFLKFEKLMAKAFEGLEEMVASIKPIRTVKLFEKPFDSLYNKFDRLPPQAFYNEEVATDIFRYLRAGMHEVEACAAALIPAEVVQKWIVLGKKGVVPFQDFYLRFEQAIALSTFDQITSFQRVDPAGAAKTILQCGKAQKRWNPTLKQQNVSASDQRIASYQSLSDDEKYARIRAMLPDSRPQIVEAKVVETEVVE